MGKPTGFIEVHRKKHPTRPVAERLKDWREVYLPYADGVLEAQGGRCMDCGIPFCHDGCPLGNRIPDWNDSARLGDWEHAAESLYATNNFPEFTGRLCPAPCEAACVLGFAGAEPVTIKQIEVSIADRATYEPQPASVRSGKSVGIVGSGPAGLAAAQQLARAGHDVVVYERDDAVGGLLRYGIPDFKLEKHHIDRRVAQLAAEGVVFKTGVNVTSLDSLRHDAVLLATGALRARDVDTPGRSLSGIHLAMDHLVQANRFVAFGEAPSISAEGKHVVIIGGGDTGADCLGVAHRQGALSVTQLDRYPLPPSAREEERDPWPVWPWILRSYAAHEEGGDRVFAVAVQEFVGTEGKLTAIRVADVVVENRVAVPVPGTVREIPADLGLLAVGFEGTEFGDIPVSPRGTIDCDEDWQTTRPGVFTAGDAHRGASLIVWAIAEGRAAAASIHAYLGGSGSLPSPVSPASRALAVI